MMMSSDVQQRAERAAEAEQPDFARVDAETKAMRDVAKALTGLNDLERSRVLVWAATRYRVANN